MGFSRPDSYRNAFNNHALALANPDSAAIENIEEKASLANRLPTAGNGNPGALAGATGDIVKANQLHSKEYTDAPAAARRVDLNGGWTLARWDWKRAVRKDRTLSDGAKLLAAALCDDFAHHETAFCNPTVETLADALGKSVRPVQRALAELRHAQWITIKYAEGRGKKSEISFLGGHGISALKPSEKVSHMASRDVKGVSSVAPIGAKPMAERVPVNAQKGARYDTPYNKDKPKLNQKKRAQGAESGSQRPNGRPDYSAYDRATARVPAPEVRNAARPVPFSRCVHPGSTAETEWNIWLADRRLPSLCQLCLRTRDAEGPGWDMPSKYPPPADDRDRTKKAELFVSWATSQAQGRSRPAAKQA